MQKHVDGGVGVIILKVSRVHRGIKQVRNSTIPGVIENQVSPCERKKI